MKRSSSGGSLTLLASVDELQSIPEEVARYVEKFLYLVCHCDESGGFGGRVWVKGAAVALLVVVEVEGRVVVQME